MTTVEPHSVRVRGELTAAGFPRVCQHRIYGMTCEQFDALEARAGGKCEICTTPMAKLNVDHDHDEAWWAVRGLVCPKCNAHMRRVDSGERVAEGATAAYLADPFWRSHGLSRVDPGPSTTIWAARIPPELKAKASAKAAESGANLTSVIIRALERYVKSK